MLEIVSCGCVARGERLKKLWIVAVGLLALAVALTLAVVDGSNVSLGGHVWHSIKAAISSSVDQIEIHTGGHVWH